MLALLMYFFYFAIPYNSIYTLTHHAIVKLYSIAYIAFQQPVYICWLYANVKSIMISEIFPNSHTDLKCIAEKYI